MQRIFDGHDTLLISQPILDELLTTLARKFSRDADALESYGSSPDGVLPNSFNRRNVSACSMTIRTIEFLSARLPDRPKPL